VFERGGERYKLVLDGFKERRGYWDLKQEAPARSLLRNWFGRGNGPVILTTG
jgi:hypothetical protein